MRFLYPAFLLALVSVSIPIIIHLFSFRRYKTVYFSHVGFLKDIKKESQKKSRLKHILILLARIFTLAFLVLAFSQPYLPTDKNTKKQANQAVAIYIDNSFSMNALSETGQLLEVARKKAVEICFAYPAATKFYLLTNDFDPRNNHFFNREQFIRQVSEIQVSPTVKPLSLIYNKLDVLFYGLDQKTDRYFYVISDFQQNVSDIGNIKNNSVYSYFMPLRPNQVSNLYIDSCWVEVPQHRLNQEETLFVRLKNNSDNNYQNLPLTLYINDTVKSISTFSVTAQNETTSEIKFVNNTGGIKEGKLEISDYPFTHDNQWFISFDVKPSIKVLLVYSGNSQSTEAKAIVKPLFENDEYISLDEVGINNIQISKLAEYNAVFLLNPEDFSTGLLNELQKTAENGSSIVLFPLLKKDAGMYKNFQNQFGLSEFANADTASIEITGIEFDHPFFKDVFVKKEENAVSPRIYGHYKMKNTVTSDETRLMWFRNGDKAFYYKNFKKGKIWIFSFPINNLNLGFARSVLFVPTLYNIVLNSLPVQNNSGMVGKDNYQEIQLPENFNPNQQIEITNKNSKEKFIPEKQVTAAGLKLNLEGFIKESGFYTVGSENKIITSLAYNYDRKESVFAYFSDKELKTLLAKAGLQNVKIIEYSVKNFNEVFSELQNGKQLWKICLIMALLFILSEILITRFWK